MFEISQLNYVAVIVAALAGMFLGAFWYSPVAFGDAWMRALGKSKEELVNPGPAMGGSAFSCVVSAVALALLVDGLGLSSAGDGAVLGLIVGVGVLSTAMLSDHLFAGTPWTLYFIQTGYRASYVVIMSIILAIWQ